MYKYIPLLLGQCFAELDFALVAQHTNVHIFWDPSQSKLWKLPILLVEVFQVGALGSYALQGQKLRGMASYGVSRIQ